MNNFADWLTTLRDRNITATVTDDTVHLHGPVTPLDPAWLDRHHDAFLHATTHPTWWTAVLTRTVDQLDADDAPDGCLARACPGELVHYTPDALPFCADHNPTWWSASLPAQEVAA